MFELIWSIAGESPEASSLTEIACSPELDSAKRDLLQTIAKRNILRCLESRGENREYFLHLPIVLAGQSYHLLERGGASDPTESGLNQGQPRVWYSHQRLLRNTRALSAGPARLLRERSFWPLLTADHPGQLTRKEPSIPPLAPIRAAAWGRIAGDAGWAGFPLEAYKRQQACRIKLPKGFNAQAALELLVESQSLLEAIVRWKIPLAYQAWLPAKHANVAWQMAHSMRDMAPPAGSAENEFSLDLTQPLGEANNPFAENAREGNWVEWQQLNPEGNSAGKSLAKGKGPTSPQTNELEGYQLSPLATPAAEFQKAVAGQSRFRLKSESQAEEDVAGRSPAVWLMVALAAMIPLSGASYLLYRFWPFGNKADDTSAQAGSGADDYADGYPDDFVADPLVESDGEPSPADRPATWQERMLERMLDQYSKELTVANLPMEPSKESAPILEFLAPRDEVRQLEFGLALPKAFVNLSFFPGRENEDLIRNSKSSFGEGETSQTEIEVRLRRIEIGPTEKALFLWRWVTPPPSGPDVNWRMGALQVGLKGKPPQLNLALEAPQKQASRTILSLLIDPPEIPRSHSATSKSTEETRLSPWVVDNLDLPALLATTPPSGEITWLRSRQKLEGRDYCFVPNLEQLESKIQKRLQTRPNSREEKSVSEEIGRHPTLGFCLDTALVDRISEGEAAPTALRILPRIYVPAPQFSAEDRDGDILPRNTDPAVDQSTLKERILARLRQLNAVDYDLTKADMERLGDWLDSPPPVAPDPDDCRLFTRYLMAEEMERVIGSVLEKPFHFRIQRRTELQTKNGKSVFLVPAYLFE